MLCDHRLSAAPAQPNQRLRRRLASAGIAVDSGEADAPRSRPSVKLRSGTWQVAQERLPSAERRVIEEQLPPSSIAAALPETRLLGSRSNDGGHGPCARIARISPSVNRTSSAAKPTLSRGRGNGQARVPILSGYHRPVTIKSDKWIRRMAASRA